MRYRAGCYAGKATRRRVDLMRACHGPDARVAAPQSAPRVPPYQTCVRRLAARELPLLALKLNLKRRYAHSIRNDRYREDQ
jgi:hypothetical protein